MDEARAVIDRLRRIEALQREGTHPRTLLAEVQAETWLTVDGGDERAACALDRCRDALAAGGELAPEHGGGGTQSDAGLLERRLLGRQPLEADPGEQQRMREAAA